MQQDEERSNLIPVGEGETAQQQQQQLPPPPPPAAGVDGDMTDDDRSEDQLCFMRTIRAFREYSRHAMDVVNSRRQDFAKLSSEHQKLLGFDPEDKVFRRQQECILENQKLLDSICNVSMELFQSYWPRGPVIDLNQPPPKPSSVEVDKVFSTLRQLVRDWGASGEKEREIMMAPIRSALEKWYPNPDLRGDVRIMVPGSGLNRTTLELCLMGFAAQGNEFSYHMLLAGHFMLNHVEEAKAFTIYPYVDSTLNLLNREDQFEAVPVPYASTYAQIEELQQEKGIEFGPMSMVAGDFMEVYSKPEQIGSWDCVVTAFFIDTAHNIVEYLQILFNALAPGGQWINMGPMMWHWSNDLGEQSIDLSCVEVLEVAKRVGFLVDQDSVRVIDSPYDGNPKSLKQMYYRTVFWTASKPMETSHQKVVEDGSNNEAPVGERIPPPPVGI